MKSLSLIISDKPIRYDSFGRFSLNDLHKSAGGEKRHAPNEFLRLIATQALIKELTGNSRFAAVESIKGGSCPGTYVVKELVYAYAMWISPAFHLQVIRAYDALTTHQHPGEISRLQLLEIALQAEQERLELAEKLGRLEARLDSIERYSATEPPVKAMQSGKRLYTVKQTVEAYPAFKEGGLRHLIFHADGHKPNGFGCCIRRIGRKVLIDADSFEAWIAQH
ncbi:KilA-N domain-containing protein [Methylomonas rhizoryzae]|uniref:KilA-N domain-containing protein n=1 Tax=Methylomonas rhizoryzae TaxID=2608981 RepID=UPI00123227D9|nr:KilA-N domain-containing protein [Methylomonas rhizoryzae]